MRKIFVTVSIIASLLFTVQVHASEYTDVIGGVLDLVEREYVGGELTDEQLYEAALIGISLALDDYSGYMDQESLESFTGDMSGRLFGIGAQMRLTLQGEAEVTRVFNGSPAEKAGILRGDIIVSVNGVPSLGRTLDEIVGSITDPERETADIEYSRDGVTKTVEIVKEEIKSLTVYTTPLAEMTGEAADDIRYINMSSFSETTADDFEIALKKVQDEGIEKLILDLRVNGGGRLDIADRICGMLVPEGPAYHVVNRRGERSTQFSRLEELPFDKVVVLVDKNTASAAELLTAAMQDAESAVVVGEATFGKGVVQSVFMLPTGGAFKLTTEEYFRRSGAKVNGIGVIPDYTVTTVMEDYETPDDLMLKKAMELLEE